MAAAAAAGYRHSATVTVAAGPGRPRPEQPARHWQAGGIGPSHGHACRFAQTSAASRRCRGHSRRRWSAGSRPAGPGPGRLALRPGPAAE